MTQARIQSDGTWAGTTITTEHGDPIYAESVVITIANCDYLTATIILPAIPIQTTVDAAIIDRDALDIIRCVAGGRGWPWLDSENRYCRYCDHAAHSINHPVEGDVYTCDHAVDCPWWLAISWLQHHPLPKEAP